MLFLEALSENAPKDGIFRGISKKMPLKMTFSEALSQKYPKKWHLRRHLV